jgi:hypothetical protein
MSFYSALGHERLKAHGAILFRTTAGIEEAHLFEGLAGKVERAKQSF